MSPSGILTDNNKYIGLHFALSSCQVPFHCSHYSRRGHTVRQKGLCASALSHSFANFRRHRISLDLLEPLNSDAKDPHRPIYSHRPSFLSPIAFDYVGAKARYPLGLGPHPFVENCYFSGPIPPSDPYISESPWPAPQKEYTTTVDGKVISLGRVTGMPLERMNYESKIDREWYKSREVKGTLPVAIALLVSSDLSSFCSSPWLIFGPMNRISSSPRMRS